MKFRNVVFCSLALLSSSFSSCSINRRINIIVPGEYVGIPEDKKELTCYLNIEEISEEEYNKANGQNVIKDAINNMTYNFILYSISSDNERIDYSFNNFVDAYNGSKGTYIAYKDSNHSWLTPQTTLNNKIRPYEDCYYHISVCEYLNSDNYCGNFILSVYLRAKEK